METTSWEAADPRKTGGCVSVFRNIFCVLVLDGHQVYEAEAMLVVPPHIFASTSSEFCSWLLGEAAASLGSVGFGPGLCRLEQGVWPCPSIFVLLSVLRQPRACRSQHPSLV